MNARFWWVAACGVLLFGTGQVERRARGDEPAKVSYKDQVLPIFQARCNGCHNTEKKRGGLALDTFSATMAGGGSGSVIEVGDPDNSRLYLVVAHQEDPVMPPSSPQIPEPELAMIRSWIEAGAPETAGSVVAMKAKPKVEFTLDPALMGKPQGEPAMPAGLSSEPVVVSTRPNAILAMAASPWAPLLAIGSHKQVLLCQSQTGELLGVLPFPEGNIHDLRFSRDGGILLVAGGQAALKGLAVGFDVKTGARLFEVGNEYDAVLAADMSPDRRFVALGGPAKVLKVYQTADNELVYECKKHTEWITAVAFSPDGVLLASGDRNGGVVVWEAQTGKEFYDLRGHEGMITALDWRLDSNLLASASEDQSIRLWEMQNGNQTKTWKAHGGVESVAFAKDGRLVTSGRDRVTKLWDGNGGHQRDFEAMGDLALCAVFTHDDQAVAAGGYDGVARIWQAGDGVVLASVAANPAPLAARIEAAGVAVAEAQTQADAARAELAALQADRDAKAQAIMVIEQAIAGIEARMKRLPGAQQAAQQAIGALDAYIAAAEGLAALEGAQTARADLQTRLGELQAAPGQAEGELGTRKAELEPARAAQAAAQKSFEEKTAVVADLAARVTRLQAQVDALTSQQAAVATDPGAVATP